MLPMMNPATTASTRLPGAPDGAWSSSCLLLSFFRIVSYLSSVFRLLGRKWHAFYGNLLTLFLIEVIDDALLLIAEKGSDPKVLMDTLKAEEDRDYHNLLSKNTSNIKFPGYLEKIDDIPTQVIYWDPNFCHTARVPSQTRYNGLATESDLKGGYTSYDHGHELNEIRNQANEGMELGFDASSYETFCTNHTVQIDHLDFFVINSYGESKLTLPNPAEKSFFDDSSSPTALHGYIALCLATCGWSCPRGVLSMDELRNETKFSMTVNGVNVHNYTRFRDCAFLKHANGHKWAANSEGLYEFRAQTLDSNEYVRVTSLTVW